MDSPLVIKLERILKNTERAGDLILLILYINEVVSCITTCETEGIVAMKVAFA